VTFKEWSEKFVGKATKAVAAVAAAISPAPPHRCDPEGFRCDCARKAEVNAASSRARSRWIPRWGRRWLRGARWNPTRDRSERAAIKRATGMGIWPKVLTPKIGSTRSWVVTLEAR
jgi:hypothetical protein